MQLFDTGVRHATSRDEPFVCGGCLKLSVPGQMVDFDNRIHVACKQAWVSKGRPRA